jgi:hypothetical protein
MGLDRADPDASRRGRERQTVCADGSVQQRSANPTLIAFGRAPRFSMFRFHV